MARSDPPRWAVYLAAAVAFLAVGLPVQAAEVGKIDLRAGEDGPVLAVAADGPLEYRAMSLQEPARLILQLPGADVSNARLPDTPRQGAVADLRLRGAEEGSPRLEVLLDRPMEAGVERSEGGLQVVFSEPGQASRSDQAPVLRDFRLQSPDQGRSRLHLETGGKVERFETFQIGEPPRLVVDLYGTGQDLEGQSFEPDNPLVRRLEVGEQEDRLRLVVHLTEQVSHGVERVSGGLSLTMEAGSAGRSGPRRVQAVDFTVGPKESTGRVELRLDRTGAEVQVQREQNRVVLDLPHTRLTEGLEKRLVVTDFGTVVDTVDLYEKDDRVRVVVRGKENMRPRTYQLDKRLVLDVARGGTQGQRGPEALGKPYEGEKLSLNFQNIEVRHALDILADFADLNIIAAQSVDGQLTLRLTEVPWDQALDLILESQGLGMDRQGQVIRVAPQAQLQQQRQAELKAQQQRQQLVPLTTELIQVNYAKAADIQSLLQAQGGGSEGGGLPGQGGGGGGSGGLLSARGSISVDERTNTLIVRDTPEQIRQVKRMVERLDRPTRQVMIEARIVKVDTGFERNLGVRWGGEYNSGGVANNENIVSGDLSPSGLAVNLPSGGVAGGPAGTLGMRLGTLSDNATLDLELSAIEQDGEGKVISSPRVITANQSQATIEQGTEIPYQQATSSGATSVSFKKAVLSLDVTPQITPDGRVILDVNAHNDSRGADTVAGPTINTEEVTTQVLVDNGETVVIGGIYATTRREDRTRVPILGRIPLLGWLFRGQSMSQEKSELLIFLTPRILEERTPALEEAGR
jgi:type IV pilus assembly protein PilQ